MSLLTLFNITTPRGWTKQSNQSSTWVLYGGDYAQDWSDYAAQTWGTLHTTPYTWKNLAGQRFSNTISTQSTTWLIIATAT